MAKHSIAQACILLMTLAFLFGLLAPVPGIGIAIAQASALERTGSYSSIIHESAGSQAGGEMCSNLMDDDADGLIDSQDSQDCAAGAPTSSPGSNLEMSSQSVEDIPNATSNVTLNQSSGMNQYLDSKYGFSIEYPPDWETAESSFTSIISGPAVEIILPAQTDPNQGGMPGLGMGQLRDASFSVTVENVSSYLDTETLQVVNATLDDYVNSKIQEINSLSQGFGGGGVELSQKYLRHSDTTVAGVPAVKIEYTTSVGGIPSGYDTTTLMLRDNKLYTFQFHTDQLKVPQNLLVAEKMIDSFKIVNPP
jgi:photosystem II reaction center protein PsbP